MKGSCCSFKACHLQKAVELCKSALQLSLPPVFVTDPRYITCHCNIWSSHAVAADPLMSAVQRVPC